MKLPAAPVAAGLLFGIVVSITLGTDVYGSALILVLSILVAACITFAWKCLRRRGGEP